MYYNIELRESNFLTLDSRAKQHSSNATLAHKIRHTTHGHIELDTHADMTVLGSNCIVLSYTGKECEVSPYSPDYETVCNVPVVTVPQFGPIHKMGQQFCWCSMRHCGWGTSWTTLWSTQTNFEHMASTYQITHPCRHHSLFQTKIMLFHFIPKGPLFVGTLGPRWNKNWACSQG